MSARRPTVEEGVGARAVALGGGGQGDGVIAANRGSIVIGSVAYLLDRCGYEVLPLAMKTLAGEPVPPRTATHHVLVTAAMSSPSIRRPT